MIDGDDLDHICVCICTYLRPELLRRLLEGLAAQETGGLFTYSVVVVDNDVNGSARHAVESFRNGSKTDMRYFVEPERNISLARNKAVAEARGKYLAFIDDDETPAGNWLHNLYVTCIRSRTDCVLGPVEPHFETLPPEWLVKAGLCERDHFETGTRIRSPQYTRTGNVLILREVCLKKRGPFDPGRGRSGGEDQEFFKWMLEKGHSILWCDEAPVFESVPPERMKRSYFLKRGLLRGSLNGREGKLFSLDTMKSLIALGVYGAALPLFSVIGQHLFMKYLVKSCDHIGKLFGLCGIEWVTERTF